MTLTGVPRHHLLYLISRPATGLAGEKDGRKAITQKTSHVASTILQSAVCRTTAVFRPQPTLFYFAGLESRPIWTQTSTTGETKSAIRAFPWLNELARPENVESMRNEYENLVLKGCTSDYSTKDSTRQGGEHKMHKGNWSWYSFLAKGVLQPDLHELCPQTAWLLTQVVGKDLMIGTPFSFAFYSTLHAFSSIAPHAAPCNLRLRVHIPLVDASNDPHQCGMRVGSEVVSWSVDSGPVVFDDAYEHEVWNRTSVPRTVLLFDVWHPDITLAERIAITEMFDSTKRAAGSKK